MWKIKTLNLIVFLCIAAITNNIDIYEKHCTSTTVDINPVGALTKIDSQEVFVNFFGYDNMPDKKTVWNKKVEGKNCTLQHTNVNGLEFVQKWNLTDPQQPVLEVCVSKRNSKINLRHEVIITTNKATKDTEIVVNFGDIKTLNYPNLDFSSFINKTGWISLAERNKLFAIKINNEKVEVHKKKIKIFKENSNQNLIHEKYKFCASDNKYFVLNKQKNFPKLHETVKFGYYLSFVSKPCYALCKVVQLQLHSTILAILLLILFIALLFLPFTIEAMEMQKKVVLMQPEIDVINNLANLSFSQRNVMTSQVHERYNYSNFKFALGQCLLLVALNIFQNVLGCPEFSDLIPQSMTTNCITIIALSTTLVIYNNFLFKNKHAFLTALFALFFINYPKVPLLCFILLHWFNILLIGVYSVLKKDKHEL